MFLRANGRRIMHADLAYMIMLMDLGNQEKPCGAVFF